MSYILSAIQFGSYNFPIGFMIKSSEIPRQIDEADLLGQIGTHAPPGLPKSQIITVSGQMGAGGDVGSAGNTLLTLDDFNNEANLIMAALGGGFAQLVAGYTPARYIMAQAKGYKSSHEPGYGRKTGAIDIAFMAPDPRWLSATTHSWTSGTITNAGNAPSYPVLTIHGPATNPTFFIGLGTAGVMLSFSLALGSGHTLVVNCDPRQRAQAVLVDGTVATYILGASGIANTLGTADCFPFIAPNAGGANTITVTGIGGGGSASMAWQDAWWL